jgi:hypothetical protein
LALEVTLGGGNELLIRIVSLLVVVALITTSGDYDSLGSLLWPPLATFGAPLCALTGDLLWHPLTAAGRHLPIALDKNSIDCLIAGGMPSGSVE